MTSDLQTLTESDTVGDARDRMLLGGINSIPIVSESGTLAGILSSHDLVDDWDAGVPVSEVMSRTVFTIDCAASIVEAAQAMRQELIHHLVVTENGATVGLISTFDLLDALTEQDTL